MQMKLDLKSKKNIPEYEMSSTAHISRVLEP